MDPQLVRPTLKRHQLADGLPMVFDLDRSHGVWLHDAATGQEYLDAFTCFATWPIGYNHPRMHEPAFLAELTRAAACKPSNSDLYTGEMAAFVEAFATRVTPPGYPHHFWISGGTLAVENALKTAFDWKARKLGRTRLDDNVNDLVILHFRDAFHGRSGYAMSLTNTDPAKIGLFPKFDWPRVHNPRIEFDADGQIANDIEASEARACAEIEQAFARHRGKVAAIIIEPIQGEGGDNHFRPEFLARLREYTDEQEAMLIHDEVQTGFFGTGHPWAWQLLDSPGRLHLAPDIVSFGKKTQVCGIYANARVEEVENNVFALPSRINSTWGGDLTDMVRCRQLIDIILGEQLPARIRRVGAYLVAGLREVLRGSDVAGNVRGVGSLVAFTLESAEVRKKMLEALQAHGVLALKSGECSVRFRLPLVMVESEVDILLERVGASLASLLAGANH